MPFIYKITNLITGKNYIDQTNSTVEDRYKVHKKSYKSGKCHKLYNAMKKYGVDNFIVETICETSTPNEDEQFYIKKYNSVKNGYNISYGGNCNRIYNEDDENIVLKLYNKYKSIHKVYNITKYSRDYIRKVLHKNNINYSNIKSNAYCNYNYIIIDKNTNNIIHTFTNVNEIKEFLNYTNDVYRLIEGINNVINGRRKSFYGYVWNKIKK